MCSTKNWHNAYFYPPKTYLPAAASYVSIMEKKTGYISIEKSGDSLFVASKVTKTSIPNYTVHDEENILFMSVKVQFLVN